MERKETYKEQIELIKQMLSEKYNQSFEVKSIGGRWGTLTNNTFECICSPDNNKEIVFEAEAACDGSFLSDEFITRLICKGLDEQLSVAINRKSSDFAVLVEAFPSKIEEDKKLTYEEFLELDEAYDFNYYIAVKESVFEQLSGQINSALVRMPNMRCRVHYYLTDENVVNDFAMFSKEHTHIEGKMGDILDECEEKYYTISNGKIAE